MPAISFAGVAIVAAAALAAPIALGLFPRVRLPAIALEIVLGIVIGPQVLGWLDTPIQVLSLLGLAFSFYSRASRSSTSAFAATCSARLRWHSRSRSDLPC